MSLWWFAATFFFTDFFHFLTPFSSKTPFVFICSVSLPPSPLPLFYCLSASLPLRCVNLWQTLLPFAVWNPNSSTSFWGKKETHGKHRSPDVSLFCFDVFPLISLTSHLPLTKKKASIQSLCHWRPLFLFSLWVATSNAQANQQGRRRKNHTACLSSKSQLDTGHN